MLNITRYPFLKDLVGMTTSSFVQSLRKSFLETGVATVPDFLSKSGLASAIQECQKPDFTTKDCYVTDDDHNAYLLPDSFEFSSSHIRNKKMRTKVSWRMVKERRTAGRRAAVPLSVPSAVPLIVVSSLRLPHAPRLYRLPT
jgi:hypothetical protein